MAFTCYQCVSRALVMQHVMRMCRIILPSEAPLAQSHFPTLSRKWHEFRVKEKNYRTLNVLFDFLYNFCLKHYSF